MSERLGKVEQDLVDRHRPGQLARQGAKLLARRGRSPTQHGRESRESGVSDAVGKRAQGGRHHRNRKPAHLCSRRGSTEPSTTTAKKARSSNARASSGIASVIARFIRRRHRHSARKATAGLVRAARNGAVPRRGLPGRPAGTMTASCQTGITGRGSTARSVANTSSRSVRALPRAAGRPRARRRRSSSLARPRWPRSGRVRSRGHHERQLPAAAANRCQKGVSEHRQPGQREEHGERDRNPDRPPKLASGSEPRTVPARCCVRAGRAPRRGRRRARSGHGTPCTSRPARCASGPQT